MRLTMRQMRYVDEVARSGSVQGASKKLGISQSSILAAIKTAEDLAGARIFDRRPAKGVVTTPVGNQFLSSVRSMLAAESEFIRSVGEVATKPPHTIRIGCFQPYSTIFMPDLLKRYVEMIGPCEFVLMESDQPQLRSWLSEGAVDFLVGADVGRELGPSVTPLCRSGVHALLRFDDPLAKKRTVPINEFLRRPLLLSHLPETLNYFTAIFDMYKTTPNIVFRTRSYGAMLRAVVAGFGVAMMNISPIGDSFAADPRLVRLPFSEDLPRPMLVLADSYGSSKPLFLRQFIEVAKAFFREAGRKHFIFPIEDARPGKELIGK